MSLKKTQSSSTIFPFKNSRLANIGNSAIITGGTNEDGIESKDCFQITPLLDNNRLIINITEFPSMNDPRERHNMIYLHKLNSILVCSSFQKTASTEMCNLTDRKWIKLRDMNTKRANSTLIFVDDRWLFCISGYVVDIVNGSGAYSNSYEVLDMRNTNGGWKEYPLINEFSVLKMSAMGCIYLNRSDFILIGGYDGSKYMDTAFHITSENGQLSNFRRLNNSLETGVIFQNAAFMKRGNCYINYDYNKLCELTALR